MYISIYLIFWHYMALRELNASHFWRSLLLTITGLGPTRMPHMGRFLGLQKVLEQQTIPMCNRQYSRWLASLRGCTGGSEHTKKRRLD